MLVLGQISLSFSWTHFATSAGFQLDVLFGPSHVGGDVLLSLLAENDEQVLSDQLPCTTGLGLFEFSAAASDIGRFETTSGAASDRALPTIRLPKVTDTVTEVGGARGSSNASDTAERTPRAHTCPHCSTRFTERKNLLRHLRRHDPQNSKFKCTW